MKESRLEMFPFLNVFDKIENYDFQNYSVPYGARLLRAIGSVWSCRRGYIFTFISSERTPGCSPQVNGRLPALQPPPPAVPLMQTLSTTLTHFWISGTLMWTSMSKHPNKVFCYFWRSKILLRVVPLACLTSSLDLRALERQSLWSSLSSRYFLFTLITIRP